MKHRQADPVHAPTLFDSPAEIGTSRVHDPDTSVAAAKSVDAAARSAEVARSMRRIERNRPGRGATSHEVSLDLQRFGTVMPQNSVARRLKDLEDQGVVVRTDDRRPGATHRQQIVWRLIDPPTGAP